MYHSGSGLPACAARSLQVIVPLMAIMFGFSSVVLWTVERNSERRLQAEVELVARAVRLPLSASLEKNHEHTLQQVLESVLGVGRVYGAYVYDRDGKLAAYAGAVEPDQDASAIQQLTEGGELTGEYQRINGRPVYSYFVPLEESGGQINGLLQVTRRWGDFERDIRRLRLIAAGLGGLLAGVALVVILLGHRSAVGKHLAAAGAQHGGSRPATASIVRRAAGRRRSWCCPAR